MAAFRRVAVSILAWVVGAVAAVAVGVLALSMIGTRLTGNDQPQGRDVITITQQSGDTSLSPGTEPSSAPTGSGPTGASPSPSPSAAIDVERTFDSDGGVVVARCRADNAYLVSWSPAAGYSVGLAQRGPASAAKVTFDRLLSMVTVTVTITCLAGAPLATITIVGDE